jgi:hypothetical protein
MALRQPSPEWLLPAARSGPSPHPLPVKNGERECTGVPAQMQKRTLSFTPSPRLRGEGGVRGSLHKDTRVV